MQLLETSINTRTLLSAVLCVPRRNPNPHVSPRPCVPPRLLHASHAPLSHSEGVCVPHVPAGSRAWVLRVIHAIDSRVLRRLAAGKAD